MNPLFLCVLKVGFIINAYFYHFKALVALRQMSLDRDSDV